MGNNDPIVSRNYDRYQQKRSSSGHNLLWSITLGNCLVADFSTNIDTFNLNKYALIKKSNVYNKNLKVSNFSKLPKKVNIFFDYN